MDSENKAVNIAKMSRYKTCYDYYYNLCVKNFSNEKNARDCFANINFLCSEPPNF